MRALTRTNAAVVSRAEIGDQGARALKRQSRSVTIAGRGPRARSADRSGRRDLLAAQIGGICVKGTAAPELVYAPDRLRHPMVRTHPKDDPDPGWARISWDEALALTASRLLEIKARHGPEAVAFPIATPAGSAAVDFMPWAWRLANAFGSPNVVTNTHICQWHRDWGATYTYGRAPRRRTTSTPAASCCGVSTPGRPGRACRCGSAGPPRTVPG